MPNCSRCQGEVLPDAVYCETCGHRLEAGVDGGQAPGGPESTTTHGSLRAEIPLLSGTTRQLRARLEGFKGRSERESQAQRREVEVRRHEQAGQTRSRGRTMAALLAGVALLALWVWLLVRGRETPPPAGLLRLLGRG